MKEETKFFSSSQGREKGRMKSDIVQKYGESVILEKLHMELDFFSSSFFPALLGILVPTPRIELCSLQWKLRVVTRLSIFPREIFYSYFPEHR